MPKNRKWPEHMPNRMPESMPENLPEDIPEPMQIECQNIGQSTYKTGCWNMCQADRIPGRMLKHMPRDMLDSQAYVRQNARTCARQDDRTYVKQNGR